MGILEVNTCTQYTALTVDRLCITHHQPTRYHALTDSAHAARLKPTPHGYPPWGYLRRTPHQWRGVWLAVNLFVLGPRWPMAASATGGYIYLLVAYILIRPIPLYAFSLCVI